MGCGDSKNLPDAPDGKGIQRREEKAKDAFKCWESSRQPALAGGREVRHGGARGKTGAAGWGIKIRVRHDRVQKEATGMWGPKDRRHPNVAAWYGGSHEWRTRVSDQKWPNQRQVKVNVVDSGKQR